MLRPLPPDESTAPYRSCPGPLALRAEHLFGLSESGYYVGTHKQMKGIAQSMAPQTRTQRQAAAKKAAATRKRNSAKQSSGTAKATARRTTTSARSTGRAARTTAKQAARATARRASAETTRLEAVAREAERVILIPVGAALEARDRVTATVRTYTDSRLTRQQLNRFERRGATALRRNRRALERQAKDVRDSVEGRANDVQSSANDVVERVLSLA